MIIQELRNSINENLTQLENLFIELQGLDERNRKLIAREVEVALREKRLDERSNILKKELDSKREENEAKIRELEKLEDQVDEKIVVYDHAKLGHEQQLSLIEQEKLIDRERKEILDIREEKIKAKEQKLQIIAQV